MAPKRSPSKAGTAKGSPAGVRVKDDGYWTWFVALNKQTRGITGKYLFFSPVQETLISIANAEVGAQGFPEAKVNKELLGSNTDYVLCLYYHDDSRKRELFDRYRDRQDVKYRWWKADVDTIRGQYSPEFLSKLPPQEAVHFQKGLLGEYQHHLFIPRGKGISQRSISEAMEEFAGNMVIHETTGGWEVHYDDAEGPDDHESFKAMITEGQQAFEAKFKPVPLSSKPSLP